MVAGAMECLGVPMIGDQGSYPFNVEDIEILAASRGRVVLSDQHGRTRLGEEKASSAQERIKKIEQVVAHRNHNCDVWGFKDPSAYLYLEQIRRCFANPRFIVIFRDFAAIAEREYVTTDLPIESGIQVALERYSSINAIVTSWRIPTLAVSYERALEQRSEFVGSLSNFLGLKETISITTEVLEFFSPDRGYKTLDGAARGSWLRPTARISEEVVTVSVTSSACVDKPDLEMNLDRNQALVRGLDHATMKGVEIGPFYSPIAPKSAGWDIIIVDYIDADELRQIARTHTSEAIRNCQHLIEDVDVVWRDQPLDIACLALNPGGYDFLIASHVVENIPDLIGFLQKASRILKPAGIVSLALPDMRYCFDFFKTLTLTNHVLDAFYEKRLRHAPSTIFQAFAYQAWVDGSGAWLRNANGPISLIGSLQQAFDLYKQERENGSHSSAAHIDAHAWSFTPSSFALIILELSVLGLVDFHIESIENGEGAEFYVQLRSGRVTELEVEISAKRQQLFENIAKEQDVRSSMVT